MSKDQLLNQNPEQPMTIGNNIEAVPAVEEKESIAFENLKALNKMALESQGEH